MNRPAFTRVHPALAEEADAVETVIVDGPAETDAGADEAGDDEDTTAGEEE